LARRRAEAIVQRRAVTLDVSTARHDYEATSVRCRIADSTSAASFATSTGFVTTA